MGVIWRDTFERPDGVVTGSDYSNMGETDASIVSGQIVSTDDVVFAYQNATRTDLYVKARLTYDASVSGGSALFMFTTSLADLNNRYNLYIPDTGTPTQAKITKTVAGTFTDILTGLPLPAVNDVVTFEKQGTLLAVYYNGVLQGSVSDASLSGPFYVSVNLDGLGGTVSLDDFEIGDISLVKPLRPNTRPRPFAPGIAR